MTVQYNANYTIPLYQLLEHYAGIAMGLPVDEVHELPTSEVIENSISLLFDFTYPIFDEAYRTVFETNFCNYFYTRELGSETVKLFKQRLASELSIKMPYYNQFYDSATWMEKYDINPTHNTSYKEGYKKTTDGVGNSTAVSNSKTKAEGYNDAVNSETPQGMLSGLDYATTANKSKAVTDNNNEGKQVTDATDNTNEEYEFHRDGNIGVQTFGDIITSNREAFINVDTMVFLDLTQLFMLLY